MGKKGSSRDELQLVFLNVLFRNRKISVKQYFSSYPGTRQKIVIRGGKQKKAEQSSFIVL